MEKSKKNGGVTTEGGPKRTIFFLKDRCLIDPPSMLDQAIRLVGFREASRILGAFHRTFTAFEDSTPNHLCGGNDQDTVYQEFDAKSPMWDQITCGESGQDGGLGTTPEA